jgi:ABC-type molybdate transport system ATPase subunit
LLYFLSGLLQPNKGEIIFDDAVLFSAVEKINVPPEQRRMGFVFWTIPYGPI